MNFKKKTHCIRGHERIPINLAKYGDCKLCRDERTKLWCKNNPERKALQDFKSKRSIKHKFNILHHGAIRRNRTFELTFEQFKNFIQDKKCSYCGGNLPEMGAGLDRIDSNLGYTLDNITTSCYTCNMMKRKLSTQEFLGHCKKILNFTAGVVS